MGEYRNDGVRPYKQICIFFVFTIGYNSPFVRGEPNDIKYAEAKEMYRQQLREGQGNSKWISCGNDLYTIGFVNLKYGKQLIEFARKTKDAPE